MALGAAVGEVELLLNISTLQSKSGVGVKRSTNGFVWSVHLALRYGEIVSTVWLGGSWSWHE